MAVLRVVAAVLRAFWGRFMTGVFEVRPVTLVEAVAIVLLLGLLAVQEEPRRTKRCSRPGPHVGFS